MPILIRGVRPRGLDLFCCAGGCSVGYTRAGFLMDGLDMERHANYPFRMWVGDALAIDPAKVRKRYDFISASPPCQRYSSITKKNGRAVVESHPDLIAPTRELLEAIGLPWIIENVEGARAELRKPVRLCGSSFGLGVRRHRLFEHSADLELEAPPCDHSWQDNHRTYPVAQSATRGKVKMSGVMPMYGSQGQLVGGSDRMRGAVAMGIDWMNHKELTEAIPPAYTLHLGRQVVAQI